jgi:uncharacterized protein (TIGR03435 family)
MQELNDRQLLREFAETNSESAFATLVARHVDLVYSTAVRFSGNPHRAEEITQAVFIILARKAGSLRRREVLSGWLYHTARLTAANVVKGEIRRQGREQEAYMQSTLNEPTRAAWEEIAPLLDDAMGRLGETDRNAVVLRYFENKSAREVAAALQVTEAAAHKRVNRALEKLRNIFRKRGVRSTTAILAGSISAHSVSVAPAALAKSLTPIALAKGATASTSTLTLIKGALKIMAWTKAKTAIVVGVGILLATGTTTVAIREISSSGTEKYFLDMQHVGDLLSQIPPHLIVRPTHYYAKIKTGVVGVRQSQPYRAIGRNQDFKMMVQYAYDFSYDLRILSPEAGLPKGGFDFLVTVPDGLGKFQAEIKRQFGYQAHREVRDVGVLFLRVKNPNASGLKEARLTTPARPPDHTLLLEDLPATPISYLAYRLELILSIPVIDQSQLSGNYDMRLEVPPGQQVGKTDEVFKAQLRQAVLDQLGLELVPGRAPVEYLVVEKVK